MESSLQIFIEMGDSERLSYRLMDERDYDFFFRIRSNQQMMKYASLDTLNTEKEGKRKFYDILSKQEDDNEGSVFLALLKGSDKAIGLMDYKLLQVNAFGGIVTFNHFLDIEYLGHDYATEMCQSMIEYLFHNLNVHKVRAKCHEDDKACESSLTKCGMTMEGLLRKSRYKDRVWKDEKVFGLLREEWEV